MQIKLALTELNKELKKVGRTFELYICGGAALQLLGIITRDTADIDVVEKGLDPALIKAKDIVAKKLRISEKWLNNQVSTIIERLPEDWRETSVEIFKESNLTVLALSRQNLINSKIHAAVDRHAEDYDDLLKLKPTKVELQIAKEYTLKQAGQVETYEVFVNGIIKTLIEELGI